MTHRLRTTTLEGVEGHRMRARQISQELCVVRETRYSDFELKPS